MSFKLKDLSVSYVSTENVLKEEEDGEYCEGVVVNGTPNLRYKEEFSMPRSCYVPHCKDEKLYKKQPNDYMTNVECLAEMEVMGLPADFNFNTKNNDYYGNQKRGDKKTFFCEICLVELNSRETKLIHIRGVKHLQKALSIAEDNKERYIRRGDISVEKYESKQRVKLIPNPELSKRKIPVRLHDKIKETIDPVVGLDFIKEWIAVSDPEMEPYYVCELCGNRGIANGMFSHLMGYKHRHRFMMTINKSISNLTEFMNLSPNDLLKLATDHSENNEDLRKKIRTRRSDEEYPCWPPGKAPWALEQRGSGIPPDIARENWGNNNFQKDHDNYECEIVSEIESRDVIRKSAFLPSISTIESPDNEYDAMKMMELGERMLELGLNFAGTETHILQECLKSVVSKMKQRRGLVTKGHTPSFNLEANKQYVSPLVRRESYIRVSTSCSTRRDEVSYVKPEIVELSLPYKTKRGRLEEGELSSSSESDATKSNSVNGRRYRSRKKDSSKGYCEVILHDGNRQKN